MSENEFHTPNQPSQYITIDGEYVLWQRQKRAFRFLVLSIVILTISLWFSDRYLRFDLPETKYRIALTLEKESARPIMRNVIKEYESKGMNIQEDSRYIQYLEFLAFVEEGDEILKNYEKLSALNPSNQSLFINYGSRLYLAGEYDKARDQFRKASQLPPHNAFPYYLESATIIAQNDINDDQMNKCLSLLARTNRSDLPVIIPTPFWHHTLPENTYAYYVIKKKCSDICLFPIYRFYGDSLSYFQNNFQNNQYSNHKEYLRVLLEELYTMGERLIPQGSKFSTYPAVFIAPLSLRIRKDVLNTYLKFKDSINSTKLENEVAKGEIEKINNLLNKFITLEERRNNEFEKSKSIRIRNLMNILLGFFELLVLYIIFKVCSLCFLGIEKQKQYVKLTKDLSIFIVIWSVIIYLFVIYITIKNVDTSQQEVVTLAFYLFLILPILYSIVKLFLNSAYQHNKLISIERTLGISIGVYLIIVCLWFITFRMICHSYPYQLNLIQDKFFYEEAKLMEELLSL